MHNYYNSRTQLIQLKIKELKLFLMAKSAIKQNNNNDTSKLSHNYNFSFCTPI